MESSIIDRTLRNTANSLEFDTVEKKIGSKDTGKNAHKTFEFDIFLKKKNMFKIRWISQIFENGNTRCRNSKGMDS